MGDVWEDYFFCMDDAEGKYSGWFRSLHKLKPVQAIKIFVENLIGHDR